MPRYYAPITPDELKSKVAAAIVAHEDWDQEESLPADEVLRRSFHAIRELTPKIEADLKKVKFDTENVETSGEGFSRNGDKFGIQVVGDLTYLGCQAGGDWEQPVYFVIYWDGKHLRAYVPVDGNPWNRTTKEAYGNDEEGDAKDAKKQGLIAPDDDDEYPELNFDFDFEKIKADIMARLEPISKRK